MHLRHWWQGLYKYVETQECLHRWEFRKGFDQLGADSIYKTFLVNCVIWGEGSLWKYYLFAYNCNTTNI